MSNWLNVADELPKKTCQIIIKSKKYGVIAGTYFVETSHYKHKEVYLYDKKHSVRFTEWQYLPAD